MLCLISIYTLKAIKARHCSEKVSADVLLYCSSGSRSLGVIIGSKHEHEQGWTCHSTAA